MFQAQCYFLSADEGGRHKPFFSNFQPIVYTKGFTSSAAILLPKDIEMVMPGENISVDLSCMGNAGIPIEMGQRFTIRESGKTIGTGIVTKLVEEMNIKTEEKSKK